MSKDKITFECNESATSLYIKILQKLSEQTTNLKIRIGGDEWKYVGDNDNVTDLLINGNYSTQQELTDINNKRLDYLASLAISRNTNKTGDSTMNTDGTNDNTNTSPSNDSIIDDGTKIQVVAIIKEFVDSNRLFTAFDITKEIRKRGVIVRHSDLKKIVHQTYINNGMPNYDRTNISIDNISGTPFLYHPVGIDPNDYFLINNLTGTVVV
jgi:hypothetical protein